LKHETTVVKDFLTTAEAEYEKFRVEQDKNYISDFDRVVKKLIKGKSKTGSKIKKNK
jgi:hypothetical protein